MVIKIFKSRAGCSGPQFLCICKAEMTWWTGRKYLKARAGASLIRVPLPYLQLLISLSGRIHPEGSRVTGFATEILSPAN